MNFDTVSSLDFCVSFVDNYGDMGFAVNLALSLHEKHPNIRIRFFSDDRVLFRKILEDRPVGFIEYIDLGAYEKHIPSECLFSFFDRPIPEEFLSRFPFPKTIIQFGYFLLHSGIESLHGTEYFLSNGHDRVIHFIPSLLPGTGGIIINPEIEEGRKYDRNRFTSFAMTQKKWISVFVYRDTLENIAESIYSASEDTVFFIFSDDSEIIKERTNIIRMPFLSLADYGIFQSLCDANVVRGENSFCQALISGKPILWDIYKESNEAHMEKIEDYCSFLGEQFPETEWADYARIMRGFNKTEGRGKFFSDFVSRYEGYEEAFGKISEYVRRECDLVKKLEEILEK